MDYGASFAFITQDEDWIKKLAIGSAVVLVGILTFGLGLIPLGGWLVETARRVIKDMDPTLPDWSDFGALIRDGLKLVVVSIVWTLPITLLSVCVGVASVFLAEQGSGGETTASLLSALISCLSLPYGLVLWLLLPGAIGVLAEEDNLGKAINPATAFRLVRDNAGGYVVIMLIAVIVAPIIELVGALVCLIGLLPAAAYVTAVLGHLSGQAYRVATAAGGSSASATAISS